VRESAFERVLQDIGRQIRDARVAAELTQEEAAATAGIDYKRWQRLEAGEVNLTVRTLIRVAAAVGADYWRLLTPLASARRRLSRSPRRR